MKRMHMTMTWKIQMWILNQLRKNSEHSLIM